MPRSLVLYQFAISHFCEKVRWALDFKALDWRAETPLPGAHARVAKRLTGQSALPVLRVGDGRALAGSAVILDELESLAPEPALTPAEPALAAEARRWEVHLDERLGKAVRRVCYATLLDHPELVVPMLAHGAPWYGRPALRLAWSRLAPRMRAGFGLDDAGRVARAHAVVEETVRELAEARDAAGFLVGGRFTRADLAAASLLAPLTREPLYPVPWPARLPDPLGRFCEALAPDLAWVSATYAGYRRPPRPNRR